MEYYELVFLSAGLAMDAFAVAICKGACIKRGAVHINLGIAASFGVFQAVMPLVGWMLGKQFSDYISVIDHWIAFLLLLFIGGKMIVDVIRDGKCVRDEAYQTLSFSELMLLSVATSIDALVVGIALALLRVNILIAAVFIGCITFVLSFAGTYIGCYFGTKFESKAQLVGGVVLVLIGVRILFDHLTPA